MMFISLKSATRVVRAAVVAGEIPVSAKVKFKRASVLNNHRQDRGWKVFINTGNFSYQFKPNED